VLPESLKIIIASYDLFGQIFSGGNGFALKFV
jgi:hypothetical protein